MKLTPFLLLLPILFSSPLYAWVINADFEDRAVGTQAKSATDGFHDTAGDSKYADTPALSGSQSASVHIKSGETAFGKWGGAFNFPQNLVEGQEIWYRINVFYPAGWSFNCKGCTEGVKMMRIHTMSASGANEGYHSSHLNDEGNGNGALIFLNSEINHSSFNYGASRRIGNPVQYGQWHTYEMYIKFSASNGIYRFWQDGELIFEQTNYTTLMSPTSVSDRIYLYSYWNNGAPQTQTSYVDDIVITSEVPGRKDANGNAYIGVGASIYIAPPKPPTPTP